MTARKTSLWFLIAVSWMLLLIRGWAADWPMFAHDPMRTGWVRRKHRSQRKTCRGWN